MIFEEKLFCPLLDRNYAVFNEFLTSDQSVQSVRVTQVIINVLEAVYAEKTFMESNFWKCPKIEVIKVIFQDSFEKRKIIISVKERVEIEFHESFLCIYSSQYIDGDLYHSHWLYWLVSGQKFIKNRVIFNLKFKCIYFTLQYLIA